ncbi:PhzF family phenazine biosynthesis protein [Robertkochia sediminum]|uniref:PhzF family phenazine biosynthesis protein n=1 Tax=Robertkochia sediminum TaxID=2785326 RepID=UPI0019316719|nr:PhzF family phenazine biosynthesis protein [Robertkochia sediminum]MBL7473328.1 PhzF family phenazine biosynthesis protein [Robertkochia sediminum]
MELKIYQVDAFSKEAFSGNPAAVCPLKNWLEDDLLQKIAAENNLSETAFYIPREDHYELRWFTPTTEVDLCGHATLATAHVLFEKEGHEGELINFYSPRSGDLQVQKHGNKLSLNFPADPVTAIAVSKDIQRAFSIPPAGAFRGKTDILLVYHSEEDIKNLEADIPAVNLLDARGVIVTARGNQVDFVSRFFAPQAGVDEDPVTGSAHTTLTPYWSKVLDKKILEARQLSLRKGYLHCEDRGERVIISGEARLYLEGKIYI